MLLKAELTVQASRLKSAGLQKPEDHNGFAKARADHTGRTAGPCTIPLLLMESVH